MPSQGRRSRSFALAATLSAVIGPLAAPIRNASAQADDPQTPPPAGQAAPAAHDARLIFQDPDATPEQRREAATRLLASDDPAIRALLHASVLDDQPPGARHAVADAVAQHPVPPDSIEPAISAALTDAPREHLPALLAAAQRFHTRSAVASVVTLLDRDPPLSPDITRALFRTLATQTGRADLPDDADAWRHWWATHRDDAPTAWYRAIARAQARRARAIAEDRDRLTTDVQRLYRELHAITPVDERSPLIADLIRDERPILAAIGFDLARRALLNARPLGPEVVDAALARLADPSVTIRREAASVLDRMDPPDIGPRTGRALRHESDPEVAAALLRIISRQPESGVNQSTVDWASRPGPARPAALSAAVALLASGYLRDPALIERVEQAAIEEIDAGQPTVAGVRFLAANGRLDRCLPLLSAPNREVALAAAEAAAASPDALAPLLEAARTHPDLYPIAARAIRRHQPSGEGLASVLSLPAPDEAERRRAIARVAPALPPDELLEVARGIADPALLNQLLAHVPTPEFLTLPDADESRRALLALYLDIRLAQGDAESVTQTLATLRDTIDTAPFAPQHVSALLLRGRIDDAQAAPGVTDVHPDVWLDALEATIDGEFAPRLAQAIRTNLDERLTDAQRARLDELEARVQPPEPPPSEEDGTQSERTGTPSPPPARRSAR